MSGWLKAIVVILGLLLATAAVVGLGLTWAGRTAEPSGQTSLGAPESSEGPAATPVDADSDTDPGVKTATFALG